MPQCAVITSRLKQGGVDLPLREPVNVRALFYQDVDRADAVGLYESLADLLQDAGVLVNDKQIRSWDGSRIAKDALNPRIEVYLTITGPAPAVTGCLFPEEKEETDDGW